MTIVSYVPEWRELFAIIGVVLAFHFVGRCASVLRLTGFVGSQMPWFASYGS